MSVCDSQTLESAPKSTSPNAETLNPDFAYLNLDPKPDEDPQPVEVTSVVVNGWGWDDDVTVTEVGSNSSNIPRSEVEVKVDGWGFEEQESRGGEEKGMFEEKKGGGRKMAAFPVRVGEPECTYYMKAGTCRFGMNCRFNHPPNKTRNKMKARKPVEAVPVDLSGRGTSSKIVGQTDSEAVELSGKGNSSMMVGQTGSKMAFKENKRRTVSESNVKMECKFYSMPGGCKYGSSCKYAHEENSVELNFLGLPKRPGQRDCTYYMTTGSCKYSTNCRFHHPDPTAVGSQDSSGYQNVEPPPQQNTPPAQLSMTTWPVQRTVSGQGPSGYQNVGPPQQHASSAQPPMTAWSVQGTVGGQDPSGYQNVGPPQQHASSAQLPMAAWPMQTTPNEHVPYIGAPSPYLTGYYLPPPGFHPHPEWNGYQAPLNPMAPMHPMYPPEMNLQHPQSVSTMVDSTYNGNGSVSKPGQDDDYPERPGQPECKFFMQTGSCKFKSACKFHHPKSSARKASGGVDLNPMRLPVRPDQPTCMHYSRHRFCKYGLACRYNHPIDFDPSEPSEAPISGTQNATPHSSESVEVKPEDSTNPVQNSEW